MLRMTRLPWIIGGVIALFLGLACSEQKAPVMQNGTAKSSLDLDRLTAQARAQNKNVYMEFTASWCVFCWNYEKGVLSTPEAQAALRKVIFVQVDYDQNPDLNSQYGITAVPTGLLLKPQNGGLRVVDRHVGKLSQERLEKFISR